MHDTQGAMQLSVSLNSMSEVSSWISISANCRKLPSHSTYTKLQPFLYPSYKFTSSTHHNYQLHHVLPCIYHTFGCYCCCLFSPSGSWCWSKMYHHHYSQRLELHCWSCKPVNLWFILQIGQPWHKSWNPHFRELTYPEGTSITSISVSPVQHHSCTADTLHVAHIWSIHNLEWRWNLHHHHSSQCNESEFRSNRHNYWGAMAGDMGLGRF